MAKGEKNTVDATLYLFSFLSVSARYPCHKYHLLQQPPLAGTIFSSLARDDLKKLEYLSPSEEKSTPALQRGIILGIFVLCKRTPSTRYIPNLSYTKTDSSCVFSVSTGHLFLSSQLSNLALTPSPTTFPD